MVSLRAARRGPDREDRAELALARRRAGRSLLRAPGDGLLGHEGLPRDPRRRGSRGLGLYADHLLRHESERRALLSSAERLALAGRLLASGDIVRAERLVEDVSFPPRQRGELLSLRTGIRIAHGADISDAELATLYTAAPLDPAARELIAIALQQRGQVAMAQTHARFLRQLGALTPASKRLIQSLEAGDAAP